MLFAIMSEDIEDSLAKRLSARPAHLARLEKLMCEDRLILAGPFPDEEDGFSGSLIVADFESWNQARAWADSDPYVRAGVYSKVVVKPFKKVLP